MVTPRVIACPDCLSHSFDSLTRTVSCYRASSPTLARLRRATASGKLYNQTTPQEVSDDRVVKWLARQGSNLRTSG